VVLTEAEVRAFSSLLSRVERLATYEGQTHQDKGHAEELQAAADDLLRRLAGENAVAVDLRWVREHLDGAVSLPLFRCHQTFATVAVFDRRQVGSRCVDPTKIPARLTRGIWFEDTSRDPTALFD